MEDEITTDYNENNPKTFSHQFLKEEQQLGVLFPESLFHIADKIDSTSTLKDSDIPSEKFLTAKLRQELVTSGTPNHRHMN